MVVDDGIATGSTARAACQVARAHGAARVVLAVPVAPPDWPARIAGDADEMVCVDTPEPFFAIGQFYADFSQTTDEEVVACLERAAHRPPWPGRRPACPARKTRPQDERSSPPRGRPLAGQLTVPRTPAGSWSSPTAAAAAGTARATVTSPPS